MVIDNTKSSGVAPPEVFSGGTFRQIIAEAFKHLIDTRTPAGRAALDTAMAGIGKRLNAATIEGRNVATVLGETDTLIPSMQEALAAMQLARAHFGDVHGLYKAETTLRAEMALWQDGTKPIRALQFDIPEKGGRVVSEANPTSRSERGAWPTHRPAGADAQAIVDLADNVASLTRRVRELENWRTDSQRAEG